MTRALCARAVQLERASPRRSSFVEKRKTLYEQGNLYAAKSKAPSAGASTRRRNSSQRLEAQDVIKKVCSNITTGRKSGLGNGYKCETGKVGRSPPLEVEKIVDQYQLDVSSEVRPEKIPST